MNKLLTMNISLMEHGFFRYISNVAGVFLLRAIIFLAILYFGFKLAKKLDGKIADLKSIKKIDPMLRSFLVSTLKVGMRVLIIAVAIMAVGVGASSVVAVIGTAGIAVGLALQGSLSNLASGVLIITNKPFIIGDYIDSDKGSGTVTAIGLFYTHLISADGKAVIIPNNGITSSAITNYRIYPTRRMDFDIGISYEIKFEEVKQLLLDLLAEEKRVLQDPAPVIGVSAYQDSDVGVRVRFWVKSEDYWDMHFEMLGNIKAMLDKNNIDIPYPRLVLVRPDGSSVN